MLIHQANQVVVLVVMSGGASFRYVASINELWERGRETARGTHSAAHLRRRLIIYFIDSVLLLPCKHLPSFLSWND